MKIQLFDFNAILTELDRHIRERDDTFDPAIVYSPLSDFSDIEKTLEFDSDRLIDDIRDFIEKERMYSELREIQEDNPDNVRLRKLHMQKSEYIRHCSMLNILLTFKKKKGMYMGTPLGIQANTIAVKPVEFSEISAAKNYYILSHDQIAAYEFSFTPVEKIRSIVEPELKIKQEKLLEVRQNISNLEREIYLEIPDALEEKLRHYGYI